jgi:hypothetical protein
MDAELLSLDAGRKEVDEVVRCDFASARTDVTPRQNPRLPIHRVPIFIQLVFSVALPSCMK